MDCFGVIEFATGRAVLFVPRLDNFYKIWMTAPTIEEWKKKYHMVDEIRFADEIEAYFAET